MRFCLLAGFAVVLMRDLQNRHLYDYDAELETHKQWPELSSRVLQELRDGHITSLC